MSKVTAMSPTDRFAAILVDWFCCRYRPSHTVAGALGPERR
jgi:hypothetical protein